MEIEHTIEEDENLRRFRVEYIEKIKTSRIFCPKCNEFPLICISQKKIAHIQFNCLKCNNEWSDNVLHFFQVDWIDETTKNEFIQRGRDMNDPETLNDLEQDRMVIIINCLKTWLNLIKSKKIFEIFNLCFKSHCDNHSDMKLSFYCKDCNVHFCNKCIEHKQHNIVTLANIIYENEEQREKLNSLTFIYVIDAIKEKISKLHKKIVIIDAPLLFESKLDQICDFTIGVIAVKDLKVKRIMDRDNISQANALSRLNAQISDEFLIKNADFIVNNNENDILKLKEQIDKLDIKVKESNI